MNNNIIAFPNQNGKFTYDVQSDLVTSVNKAEVDLWGWDMNKPLRYSDVLASVDDPTKFMDMTLGHNQSYIVTSPIQIDNGNVVREELTYHYHPDDYENRTLIKIEGVTNFLQVA